MKHTVLLTESIRVPRPAREVFVYLRDFSRVEEWDPGVSSARRLDAGAIGAGSCFEVIIKVAGLRLRMHYRLDTVAENKRLQLTGTTAGLTVTDDICLIEQDGGTQIEYRATLCFSGPLAAVFKRTPDRVEAAGRRAVAGLQRALEDKFTPPRASRWLRAADRMLLPGMLEFTRLGYRRARQHWQPVSACMEGRHVVLTGATSGLGYAAAQMLAARGSSLTLVARDAQRAEQAAQCLRRGSGNPHIKVEIANLSLTEDVHALADRLLQAGKPVDVLINNAGALFNDRQVTTEGLECSFALLLLSPYVLTERLLPLLRAAGSARVVNVSSGGMYAQRLRADDLQYRRKPYAGAKAYAAAKRGLLILSEHWARAWAEYGIVSHAMHPGWADTPGIRQSLPGFHRLVGPLLRNAEQGADTMVWLAMASEATRCTGLFWLDRQPHDTHLLPGTRETAEQRVLLLQQLAECFERSIGRRNAA